MAGGQGGRAVGRGSRRHAARPSSSPSTPLPARPLRAQEVGGALVVLHTRQLKDLSGLAGLARVGGDVNLVDNRALWTLEGLGELAEIGA
jgi:hypothetical protein